MSQRWTCCQLQPAGGKYHRRHLLCQFVVGESLGPVPPLVPNAAVIAVLLNPKNANVELEGHQTQETARLLGLRLVLLQGTGEREIDEAVASLIQQGAAALIVSGDAMFYGRRAQIAELALRYTIPTSCPYRDQTDNAG